MKKIWGKMRNVFFIFLLTISSVNSNQYTKGKCLSNLIEPVSCFKDKTCKLSNLEYDLSIWPDYFSSKYEEFIDLKVTSNSKIKFDLETNSSHLNPNNKSLVSCKLNCVIIINDYQIIQSNTTNWKPKIPENTTASGLLYFEDLNLNNNSEESRAYKIDGIFPVGSNLHDILSNFKAKYKISVARPNNIERNYTVFSNMPQLQIIEQISKDEAWIWDHFQETVPIYPEQVSIVILGGNINKIEYKDNDLNRTISLIWSNDEDEKLEDAEIGKQCFLKEAPNILKLFESKFRVKYPLEKLDIIAGRRDLLDNPFYVPLTKFIGVGIDEFIIGYLSEPPRTCSTFKERLISVIVQQFTGFVKSPLLSSSKSLHWALIMHFFIWGYEKVEDLSTNNNYLMTLLNFEKLEENDYFSFFGEEALFLKMLETMATRSVFEEGIIGNFMSKIFENDNKILNVEDIFEAIEKSIKNHNKSELLPLSNNVTINFKYILENWKNNQGYPLIRVKSNDNPNVIQISIQNSNLNETSGFWIPLEIVTNLGNQFTWLSNSTNNITFDLLKNNKSEKDINLVMVNPNILGHFRVLYDSKILSKISNQLARNHSVISNWGRIKLLKDHFEYPAKISRKIDENYLKLKLNGLDKALELMRYLQKEDDPDVWAMILNQIQADEWIWDMERITNGNLFKYINYHVDKALRRIGYNESIFGASRSESDDLARKQLISISKLLKSPGYIEFAKGLMNTWKNHPGLNYDYIYPKNNKNNELECLALIGTKPNDPSGYFEFYLERVNKTFANTSCGIPVSIETAMFCTENPEILKPVFRNVIENGTGLEACFGEIEEKIFDKPALVIAFYQVLRESVLDGKLASKHLANFVLVNAFYRNRWPIKTKDMDFDLLNDLEEIFLMDGKTTSLCENDNILDDESTKSLRKTMEFLRKQKEDGEKNRFVQSGIKWLETEMNLKF